MRTGRGTPKPRNERIQQTEIFQNAFAGEQLRDFGNRLVDGGQRHAHTQPPTSSMATFASPARRRQHFRIAPDKDTQPLATLLFVTERLRFHRPARSVPSVLRDEYKPTPQRRIARTPCPVRAALHNENRAAPPRRMPGKMEVRPRAWAACSRWHFSPTIRMGATSSRPKTIGEQSNTIISGPDARRIAQRDSQPERREKRRG